VHSLARRESASTDPKLHSLVTADTSEWASKLSSINPPPSIFFSALGTTRGAAGGVEGQRKIDLELNLSLAEAAKKSGVKVYVLISTGGANANSFLAYPKMKGELEEGVKALGFDTTVILRPGLLVGDRSDSRPTEFIFQKIAGLTGFLGKGVKDVWAQDADVVGKAAVAAGLKALEGGQPKVWQVGQAEIVKLGRTEWKA
jgi:uncharacterized protein YbjT (DUF2867 family)